MYYESQIEFEQDQKEENDRIVFEVEQWIEIDRNFELQSEGCFDGKMGIPARFPEEEAYWFGWCAGSRERYLKEQNKKIEQPF